MIVHSYYEEDPRVRREAESLVAAGRPVVVLGLRQPDGPAVSEVAGVRVQHLDVQRHQGAGLGVYLREYASFLARAMFAAVRLHRRERFALVQVHSLPDYLVFAALPLRLVGVPVLLDLHEAMPEFFRSRFPGASNPLVHRLLMLQERLSIAASTAVITVNPAMRDRLVRLGVPAAKAGVVVNSPSLGRFDIAAWPRRAFREDGRLRLIYTGALTPTYELDVAIAAVARVAAARPALDVTFEVYGRGDTGTGTGGAGGRARHRGPGHLPRPHRDRGRAGGRGRSRHRPGPHPPRPVHRHEPLDQGVRVRRDGQARRRVAPADGRADVPAGDRGRVCAGRSRRRWPTRSSPSPTTRRPEKRPWPRPRRSSGPAPGSTSRRAISRWWSGSSRLRAAGCLVDGYGYWGGSFPSRQYSSGTSSQVEALTDRRPVPDDGR